MRITKDYSFIYVISAFLIGNVISAVNVATGAIVGGVAGGVVLLFAGSLIVLAWWSKMKRRDQFFNVPGLCI